MEQRQRDRVMSLFRAAKADLLVATDVAARGLDIEHLSHVVNYDVPVGPGGLRAPHRPHRPRRARRASRSRSPSRASIGCCATSRPSRKQKIEIATVPTVADLRARRLDVTRASLRERLLAGDADDVRVVVESLAQEFDIVRIAAAAVKLAHEAGDGGAATRRRSRRSRCAEADRPRASRALRARPPPSPERPASATRWAARKPTAGAMTRLFIGAGRRRASARATSSAPSPGEAGIKSKTLGSIEIADGFSIVEVPKDRADDIIAALRKTRIRGRKVTVNRDRKAPKR